VLPRRDRHGDALEADRDVTHVAGDRLAPSLLEQRAIVSARDVPADELGAGHAVVVAIGHVHLQIIRERAERLVRRRAEELAVRLLQCRVAREDLAADEGSGRSPIPEQPAAARATRNGRRAAAARLVTERRAEAGVAHHRWLAVAGAARDGAGHDDLRRVDQAAATGPAGGRRVAGRARLTGRPRDRIEEDLLAELLEGRLIRLARHIGRGRTYGTS
jgi:hypothetical protein